MESLGVLYKMTWVQVLWEIYCNFQRIGYKKAMASTLGIYVSQEKFLNV